MDKTITINNEQFHLHVVTGIALSASRETIRHRKIEVSGGEYGYVTGNHVHMDPIEIEEKVTEELVQNFVLVALDGVEHEYNFKDEKYSANVRPGNIVSVVHGAKAKGGKARPYMIYNHNSRQSGTLNAFVNAVALSNLRLILVAGIGVAFAFLTGQPWYGYIVSALVVLGLHYLWFIKIKGRRSAGDYLVSDECKAWLASLRKNDDAYRAMIAPAPAVSQG